MTKYTKPQKRYKFYNFKHFSKLLIIYSMVLFIEKLFSLKTNRFQNDKYDLDLTYIFP